MYLNTEESIERARKVHQRFGSWEAARRAGAVSVLAIEGREQRKTDDD